MQIRETFATRIQERIEPVVKVADRKPHVLANELANLVITPQWEQYLHRILDAYTDAADREDEQGIGIWISGFFGSGKSLLMKTLGTLMEGGEIDGQKAHDIFLGRLPSTSPDRGNLQRFLTICERKLATSSVGGNIHAEQATSGDSLALITFKLFAQMREYTRNWPLAWAVEYHIDAQGLTHDFRQRARARCSDRAWDEIRDDAAFYANQLFEAAAAVLPDHFRDGAPDVERAVTSVAQSGISPADVIERYRRWCQARDGGGKRHKLLLQLDELGQWIASGNANERTMQVQALVECAAEAGGGRVWIAVTAHGDVQALQQNVQQEMYAKILQRFTLQCKLSNDDISRVVEERLLRKTQPARVSLAARFTERSGELTDLGTPQRPQRVYPTPDPERFPLFYPYLPWTVAVIPDVVRGIAQAAGRGDELTGSTRTMIGVVQGAIIETPGLLEAQVGRLLSLADLYEQLASDVPIETKGDLNKVRDSVPEATPLTSRVARALFLLGEADYIPCTVENVTRAQIDTLDANLASACGTVRTELDRLVAAGYAKQIGDQYTFLNTQQRGFQDKVRIRRDQLVQQTYELSQALKEYDSEDALRFDRVQMQAQGREIPLKLEIDGRVVRNPTAAVTIHLYSPFQRALDPQIADDAAMNQRSAQEPNNIVFRMDDVLGLRTALALALAANEIADQVISAHPSGGTEVDVARQARQNDVPSYKADVRRLLAQAIRSGTIFFRGTSYQLASGESPSAAVRATLAQLLPTIYSRLSELPHRIVNEEAAVKAALANNTTNADLQALGVYRADGTLNDSNALLSTLRGRLPLVEQDQQAIPADQLRTDLERPPFGWDGNAVKAGLALLLRASACRLIDSSRLITDPSDPDAVNVLTKEMRFRGLRVQGVRSELGTSELRSIRDSIEAIFGTKPNLVAATLNNVLGEQLKALAEQAKEVHEWAVVAHCPLPLPYESGTTLVEEMLNSAALAARLPRFLEQAEPVRHYADLLQHLAAFRAQYGTQFSALRDFFTKMVDADITVPELRQFIDDWRTVTQQRTITETSRWNEVQQSYTAAQQALARQATVWCEHAAARLQEVELSLPERVRNVGVPEDKVAAEVASLRAPFEDIRERLAQPGLDIFAARGIQTALSGAEINLPIPLRVLREQYGPTYGEGETHLRWRDVASQDRIASAQDLDSFLATLRTAIESELSQGRAVIIE